MWGNLIEWKKRWRLHTQNLFHKVSLMNRNSCLEWKGLVLLLCILTLNSTATIVFLLCFQGLRGGRNFKKKKMGYLLYFTREQVLILGFVQSFFFVAWLKDLRYPAVTEEVKREPGKVLFYEHRIIFFNLEVW